ncbi:unnamed protein product, partial [Caenorhabditis auriculariae]
QTSPRQPALLRALPSAVLPRRLLGSSLVRFFSEIVDPGWGSEASEEDPWTPSLDPHKQ